MAKITRTMKVLKITEGEDTRYMDYVPGIEETLKSVAPNIQVERINAIVEMTTADFVKYGTVKASR